VLSKKETAPSRRMRDRGEKAGASMTKEVETDGIVFLVSRGIAPKVLERDIIQGKRDPVSRRSSEGAKEEHRK